MNSLFFQAEGFHGELEEFLQWLRRTDSQLSAAKPTGGLPETAREQLQQHVVTLDTVSGTALITEELSHHYTRGFLLWFALLPISIVYVTKMVSLYNQGQTNE